MSASDLKGVVYTPQETADEIARFAVKKLGRMPSRILEPSVGEGAFVNALLAQKKIQPKNILAIDIDGKKIKALSNQYPKLDAKKADFLKPTELQSTRGFDLIIGNPPFIRRHDYTPKLKANADKVGNDSGYTAQTIKNAWVAFLLKSAALLKEDGILAFILPYEFILVNYGLEAQEFIRKRFNSVEIFIPDKKAFPKIDQDAVLLIASNKGRKGLYYKQVKALSNLYSGKKTKISVKKAAASAIERVGFLLDPKTKDLLMGLEQQLKRISDYCTTAPGVVTGANDFFVVDKSTVEEFSLQNWAKPIVKKKSMLNGHPIFSKDEMDTLAEQYPASLIDLKDFCQKTGEAGVCKFITSGKEQKLTERFKCRTREPWYVVPMVDIGDGFIFKRAHNFHQLYINEAKCLTTDGAYHIHMANGYTIKDLAFSYHNSLTATFAEIYGRFYGGGVLEMTPKEFRALPIYYTTPNESDFARFLEKFPQQEDFSAKQFEFADDYLRTELGLKKKQLSQIQGALKILRNHRLRHGGRGI